VVTVDVQITLSFDRQVDQTVAGDLIEHVVKKTNARRKLGLTRSIQVDLNRDSGLLGVAYDVGLPHGL
jgi:hypothetical protein